MKPLSFRSISAYAALGAPLKALTLTTTLYLPAFYAVEGKLGLTVVGFIFLIMRTFDIVIDPFFGWVSDRTNIGMGRRRFWIFLGIVPLAVSVWMVFRPSLPVSANLFIGWLGLFYLAWTVVTVSHTAWAADMTADKGALRRLIGWREWAGIIGMLAIMVVPAIQEHHGESLPERMGALGIALTVAVLLAGASAVVSVPETPAGTSTAPFHQFICHLGRSNQLRRILIADLLVGCGYGMTSALMLFITKSWLHVAGSFSTIMLAYFIGMSISVPGWIRCADRIGTKSTYRLAIGLLAGAQLLILVLPTGKPMLAGMLWFLQGVLTGAYQFGLNGIMAETAERDRDATGETLSGVYFALLATTNKVGYAMAIGLVYPLLDALGFSPQRIGHGTLSLLITYACLPAVFFAASAWCVGRGDHQQTLDHVDYASLV
jgi:Na+/melibiose symporter-like transporter